MKNLFLLTFLLSLFVFHQGKAFAQRQIQTQNQNPINHAPVNQTPAQPEIDPFALPNRSVNEEPAGSVEWEGLVGLRTAMRNAASNVAGNVYDFVAEAAAQYDANLENQEKNNKTKTQSEMLQKICEFTPPSTSCSPEDAALLIPKFDYIENLRQVISTSYGTGLNGASRAQACACLNARAQAQPAEVAEVKSNLVNTIKKELNKKLLNDYASHIENFHYFYWASPRFHERSRDRDVTKANRLLCSDNDRYLKAMDDNEKCKSKNLTQHEKVRKISSVFESLGMELNGNLSQNLDKVKADILGPQNYNCSTGVYSRYCFDRARNSISKSEGREADSILTSILKSDSYKEKIETYITERNVTPLVAISLIISEDLENKDKSLLNILSPAVLGNDLHAAMSRAFDGNGLNDERKERIFNRIDEVISLGVHSHPGLDMILKDKTLFKEAGDKIGNKTSLMDYLETDVRFMENHFDKNCESLVKNISEAVCSSDEEILSSVGDKEIYDLIKFSGEQDQRTKMIIGTIACQNDGKTSDLMKDLLVNPNLSKTSDYFIEKTVEEDKRNTLFFNLKRERGNPNSPVSRTLAALDLQFGSTFASFDPSSSGSDFFGRMSSPDSSTPMTSSNPTEQSSENFVEKMASVIKDGTENSVSPNYQGNFYSNQSNAEANSTTVTAANESVDANVDMKKQFREFLRGKKDFNEEEVDELLGNANDDMMKELMELRAEMDRNQQRLLELSSENERLKLESMQRKLANLQQERAALDPGDPQVRSSGSSTRTQSYLQPTVNNPGRNLASAGSAETGGNSSGTTSVSSSEAASLSGANRALLSSATRSDVGRGPASDSSGNPVVVPASTAKNGSIEIRSQEVGLDLLNYLSNNGSDIQTLINLKTSGIIYRYRSLENGQFVEKEVLIEYSNLNEDVKKIIDNKIAQNEDRSKEVLRLDNEIKELQRVYSYESLQFLLAEQMKNNPGH